MRALRGGPVSTTALHILDLAAPESYQFILKESIMLILYDWNELLTVAGRYVYPDRMDRPRKNMHTLAHTLHHRHDLDKSIPATVWFYKIQAISDHQ